MQLIPIYHFKFEDDFIEDNVRCIPMVVRFKLDAAGIKLKLNEWCKFNVTQRNKLAVLPCSNEFEVNFYRNYLYRLVVDTTGHEPTNLPVNKYPAWADLLHIDNSLLSKANEYDWTISLAQWNLLTDLQRFALIKLYRPGHENKNFPKAMKEFGLVEN